ncbi:MAG: hypothetical protein WBX09_07415 [Terracidiphilus sp.]
MEVQFPTAPKAATLNTPFTLAFTARAPKVAGQFTFSPAMEVHTLAGSTGLVCAPAAMATAAEIAKRLPDRFNMPDTSMKA